MKSKKIKIEERNYQVSDSRSMIFKVIDNQINNYKLQYITMSERDHSIPSKVKDKKIKQLEAKKADLQKLFTKLNDEDYLVDFNISIDVKLKNKEKVAVC